MAEIRFITYLSPSLPAELFECVARAVAGRVGLPASLQVEERFSGPPPGRPDPFSSNLTDVGFLCSSPFLWLSARNPSPVRLLPAAPVFEDPRAGGRPVYFSDVIISTAQGHRRLADLRAVRWAYNDTCSLSGYLSLLRHLDLLRESAPILERVLQSGSHLESLRAVAQGEADAAAIDSNVLGLWKRRRPELERTLLVVESWGPFPIQPVVVRSTLDSMLVERLTQAFLNLSKDPGMRKTLGQFGLRGFVPVTEGFYEEERKALAWFGLDRQRFEAQAPLL